MHQSGGHEHTWSGRRSTGRGAPAQFVFTAKVPEIAVEVLDSSGRDSDDALTARLALHDIRFDIHTRLHDIHMLLRVGGGLGECAGAVRHARGAARARRTARIGKMVEQ